MTEIAKKTLLVVTPYFPPSGGGLERYAYEITSRLNANFHWNVIVLTSGVRRGADVIETIAGMKVIRLSYFCRISNTPIAWDWFKKIKKILTEEKPDVINIHTPVPGIGDVTAFLAKSIPVVVTYHTGSMRKGKLLPDIAIYIYEHWFLKHLLNRAKQIVCSSDFVRLKFLAKYQYKSLTITPAVDTNIFKPDAQLKAVKPTIIFVAGLNRSEQYKGLQRLLDAMEVIKKKIPDVQLVVVGEGDMRAEYERRVQRMDLSKSVTFTGRLFGDSLVQQYQHAHVTALPTSNESFSMAILEAMACGLPVVSTRVGGIPQLVDQGTTGYLVTLFDKEQYVCRLIQILENQIQAAIFGEAGRAKVRDNYGWDVRVADYNIIFTQQLEKRISVLIICKEYPPHVTGGLGIHYYELINKLKKYCDVNLICAKENDGSEGDEKTEGLNVYRVRTTNIFPFNHIMFNLKAIFLSFKIKTDVVHLCSPFGLFNAFIKIKPTVVKIHTVYSEQRGKSIYNKIYFPLASLIDKFLISQSDAVMTTSNFMKNDIHTKYKTHLSKISVMYNGIDEKISPPTNAEKINLRKSLNISTDANIVMYVGRFVQRKGALKLIQSVPAVIRKLPNTLFILIGGGFNEGTEYENQIKTTIESLKIKNNVLILPWLSHEKVLSYYKLADVFIHPATYEPFGNNLVEAMASGLPVISTKSGGPEEIIKQNGIILTNDNPANISENLLHVLTNNNVHELLSQLSVKRAQEFSWNKTAKETIAVYKTAINLAKFK